MDISDIVQKSLKHIQEQNAQEENQEEIKKEDAVLQRFLEERKIYFRPPFLQIGNEYIRISKIDRISIFEDNCNIGLYSDGCVIAGLVCDNINECILLVNIIIEITKGK